MGNTRKDFAEKLVTKMKEINEVKKGAKATSSMSQVSEWVTAAGKLKPTISHQVSSDPQVAAEAPRPNDGRGVFFLPDPAGNAWLAEGSQFRYC